MHSGSQTYSGRIHTSVEAYGCQLNDVSQDELFASYDRTGFLYEAKRQALQPYWEIIRENWRLAMKTGEHLFWTNSRRTDDAVASSLVCWKSTQAGWVSQHLASDGHAGSTMSVLLSGQGHVISRTDSIATQNWFQPSKNMPRRVFGTMVKTIGAEHASVTCLDYMTVPLQRCGPANFALLALWQTKLQIARPTIVRALSDADRADKLIHNFLTFLLDDDTLTYSVLFTISGVA